MSIEAAVFLSARMGSKRLPGKSLFPFNGIPLVSYCIRRLKNKNSEVPVFLLTSINAEDDVLAEWGRAEGIEVFRGHATNLVDRYLKAAELFQVQTIIRATGDCPFIDYESLKYCLKYRKETYSAGKLFTTKGEFPVGIDFEIFDNIDLKKLYQTGHFTDEEKEHLTLYIYRHMGEMVEKIPCPRELLPLKDDTYTLDTAEDYKKLKGIAERQLDCLFDIRTISALVRTE